MYKIFKKNNALLFSLIIVLSLFFFFDLDSFFTIDFFKEHNKALESYVENNIFISLIYFYSFFLILLFFFLPVSAFMLICSGFLFSPYLCIPLSISIIAIGGTLNFILLKKINFFNLLNKANLWITKIDKNFKKNEIQFLLLLRLIPIPFIIQNAITVVLNVSLKKFFFTTFFGAIPYGAIYSLGGLQLKKIINIHDKIGMSDILNYENFLFIFLLIFFIFLTIFFKKKIN